MLVAKKIRKKFPPLHYRINSWSHIYGKQKFRWGFLPSLTAHMALADIENHKKGKGALLDIGCGYCRDLLLFNKVFPDMILDGLEPVAEAIELARPIIPKLCLRNMICADIFDFGKKNIKAKYMVIFANYFLHLFSEKEQVWILQLVSRILKKNGIGILSWVSMRDRHYGKGQYLNNHIYEVYNGIPWRFTTCSMIEKMVHEVGMKVLKLNEFIEIELIKGKPDKVHGIYLVCLKH